MQNKQSFFRIKNIDWYLPIFLFITVLLFRLSFVAPSGYSTIRMVNVDSQLYTNLAKFIYGIPGVNKSHDGFGYFFYRGYPLLIGAIYKLFGFRHEIVIFIQTLLATFSVVIFYKILTRLINPIAATLIALLYSLNYDVYKFDGLILSDSLFLSFIIFTTYFFQTICNKKIFVNFSLWKKLVVVLGFILCTFYIVFTRPTFFPYISVLISFLTIYFLYTKHKQLFFLVSTTGVVLFGSSIYHYKTDLIGNVGEYTSLGGVVGTMCYDGKTWAKDSHTLGLYQRWRTCIYYLMKGIPLRKESTPALVFRERKLFEYVWEHEKMSVYELRTKGLHNTPIENLNFNSNERTMIEGRLCDFIESIGGHLPLKLMSKSEKVTIFIKVIFLRIYYFWSIYNSDEPGIKKILHIIYYVPLYAFLIWGIHCLRKGWSGIGADTKFFYIFAIGVILVYWIFLSVIMPIPTDQRYRMPVYPFLMILLCPGLNRLLGFGKKIS